MHAFHTRVILGKPAWKRKLSCSSQVENVDVGVLSNCSLRAREAGRLTDGKNDNRDVWGCGWRLEAVIDATMFDGDFLITIDANGCGHMCFMGKTVLFVGLKLR